MKIAGTIILFYPQKNILKIIQEYSSYLEFLFICDNTENPDKDLIENIIKLPKVIYVTDGKNKGIGIRLNQAIKYAQKRNIDLLLTMDQDSFLDNNTFTKYIDCVSCFKKPHEVAMYGMQFYKEKVTNEVCEFEEILQTITSGSLVNLKIIDRIGTFNEDYFIDFVDSEFCYRANKKGYKIILFKNVLLTHNIGEIKNYKSIKTLKETSRSLHSALRIYYMVRNFLYLKKEYKNSFAEDLRRVRKDVLNRIKNNFLYEKEKIKLIRYLIKAYRDFKRNKKGAIN